MTKDEQVEQLAGELADMLREFETTRMGRFFISYLRPWHYVCEDNGGPNVTGLAKFATHAMAVVRMTAEFHKCNRN